MAAAMRRLMTPVAALWWGLRFAFLNPALDLLVVARFVALSAVPAYADRHGGTCARCSGARC